MGKELKKILYINTVAGKGGAANICMNVAEYFGNLGYEVNVLVKENFTSFENVIELDTSSNFFQKILLFIQNFIGIIDILDFRSFKILSRKEYKNADLVHIHNNHGMNFNPLLMLVMSRQKPVIWTLHDEYAYTGHCGFTLKCTEWQKKCFHCKKLNVYVPIRFDVAFLNFYIKKLIYEHSKLTIATPSEWLLDNVSKSILKNSLVRFVPYGININTDLSIFKKEAKIKLNLPLDKKIILYSADGGISNIFKGGKYILKLINDYKNRDDIFFILLGDKRGSSGKNFIGIPYVSDIKMLYLYYLASDIFAYPTLADNYPLVVMESLLNQLPVLSFDTGGVKEIVTHKVNSYIARYEDYEDFKTGFEFLLNNDLRPNIILDYEKIKEKFSIKRMGDEYKALYNKVMEERSL